MLNVMIVGYGFAGKHLHHRCLGKMRELGWNDRLNPQIVAVDPAHLSSAQSDAFLRLRAEMEPIDAHDAARWVIHICTPPEQHFADIKIALERGYRQILVEKPAAASLEQLHELIALEREYRARILVVANWVSSPAVAGVVEALQSGQYGTLRQMVVVQNKSRFMRSRARRGEHLFDIEMPHQVALALYLGGPARLQSVHISDMVMPDLTIPDLGSGRLVLAHANGITSDLRSSLVHTARERYLQLTTDRGYRLQAFFPTGGDDSYSRILITSPQGEELVNQLLFDDPLTLCFIRAYRDFLQSQQQPECAKPAGMDLLFNAQKVSLLEEAKRRAAQEKAPADTTPKTVIDNGVL